MLTHMHMVIYTWWCWHISEGGGVWAVERGLGFSLPPAELASASGKWNAYFPLRRMWELEAKSRRWSSLFCKRQTLVAEATDAGPTSIGLSQARSAKEEATDAWTLTQQTLAQCSVAWWARECQTLSHVCRSIDRHVYRSWAGRGSILERICHATDAGAVSCRTRLTLGVDHWFSNKQWTRGDVWEW
jgi:hypothetical protein